MFRFIGLIVILFIFVVGFTPIKKWYEGELNPKQVFSEIRQSISNAISTDSTDSTPKEILGDAEADAIPESSVDDKDITANQNTENQEEKSTDQIASELQKKVTN